MFTYQVFGHGDVSVVDGGLQRWKFRGYPVEHGPPAAISPQEYHASFNDRLIRTFEQMIENYNNKNEQVLPLILCQCVCVCLCVCVCFSTCMKVFDGS